MMTVMEAGVKLAAIAGKGAETKPCGAHTFVAGSGTEIKCAAELCCGNWVRTPAEESAAILLYGKDNTTKMLAFT